jgi:hypothetical protein
VYPKSYYSRTNLENDGVSSLDDFVIAVVVETQDLGGTYNLDINTDGSSSRSTNTTSLNFTGDLVSEETNLNNLDISTIVDGVYKFDLTITDPNGNVGEPETLYYLIEDDKITLLGATNTLSTLNNTFAQLTMYPNPVNHFYHIETTEELLLEIFDIHGKLLITKKLASGKNSVNTNTLAAGYYFFKIANSKEQVIKKVLKK